MLKLMSERQSKYTCISYFKGIFDNGIIYVDPSESEEVAQNGFLVFSYMPQKKEITNIRLAGEVSVNLLRKAIEISTSISSRMLKIMAKCLKES